MDDLYDNLENYNDVNIVNELKFENKELKLKLEEYSKAMVQLQKDLDKLSSEYKKLEINYSSLLKTARAEIQRKTEMINTLNLEKDRIVLKTLKNTGKRVFNAAKSQMYSKGLSENDESTETVINNDKKSSEAQVESKIQKDNRVDSHQTTSVDSISSISKENKSSISEERASKAFDSREKNKNKENLPTGHHKDSIVQSSENETNKRLTTPVNSYFEATFSSDEDSEFKNSDNIRKSPIRNEVQYYERQDNRDYRTELYEHYESLKESSRRPSKYLHSERYKNADKYEAHSRHRRHYSPERNQHRYSKEYTEYTEHYPPRGDYGRQRLMRSPPSDKYNRSKSRDKRFAYDREKYRDHDKHSTRFYEHASGKHKIRNELDEPSCKRQKIETYNSHIEENIWYLNEKEREFAEQQGTHIPKPQECAFQESSSCQSPDYIVIDSTFPEHSVKEIMGTAATKLEDPRVSSKKYIRSLPNNTLSTVVGRNIDLKIVDKSVWGIEKIDVPVALTKRVSEQESDNLLKDIYVNIEDSSLHDSLESGELQSYDDVDLATFYSRKIANDDGTVTNNKHQNTDSDTRILTDLKETVIDKKVSEKPQSNKFKIPKIKKPDLDVPKLQGKQTCDKFDNNLPDLRDLNDDENNQPSEHNNKHDSDKLSFEKELAKNNVIQNSEQTDSDKRKEIMKTIEGDLELSDEASDVELHKDTNQTWSKTGPDKVENVEKDVPKCPSFQENNSATTISHSVKISKKKVDKTKSLTISGSTKDSSKENSKKRKRKRKSSEQNEIKESHDSKKPKERECKQSLSEEKKQKEPLSKETLNKFGDLFGDSSSLITPDDLGLNNVPVQSTEKYSSIFENTQDAVDLSGEVIISKLTSTNESDTIDSFNSGLDTVVEKVCDENTANKNNFSVNVTVVNDDNVDTNTETKNVNSNNACENAKSAMSVNENSIVKTVVISSGTQNECVSESVSKDSLRTHVESVTANTDDVALKKCPLNISEALATSTPQKRGDTVAPIEQVYEPSKLSNSSNINDNIEQNEADIPDVRIFVRRRRKPVKKAN